MTESDLAWLAGLLEGEGSFMRPPPSRPNCPCIALRMTDEWTVRRTAELFGVRYVGTYKLPNRKQVWYTKLQGGTAVDLMKELRPYMSPRRKEQIDSASNAYTDRRTKAPSGEEPFPARKGKDADGRLPVVNRASGGRAAIRVRFPPSLPRRSPRLAQIAPARPATHWIA